MQRLAQLTRETVELSTLDQDQLVLLDQIEGIGDVRLYSRVGAAYPYFHVTAVGKLYLAYMEPIKRKNSLQKIGLPAVTEKSITDIEVLERELQTALQNGYACENQELRKGVCRVVAPIFDHNGKLAGGLGVAAPVFRMDSEDFAKVGEIVKDIAHQVSWSLGGGSTHGK
jgi:DNA-binding IclR family transcriptional regulator